MFVVLRQVWLPLLSLVILTLGNGMFSTFLVLKLHHLNVSSWLIGSVGGAYYVGMVVGAFHAGKIILASGHIRSYAGFASLIAVLTVMHGLLVEPGIWIVLRFLSGYCMAGLFVTIESWVLNSSTMNTRGQVLSFYMVAIYGAQACGQFFIMASPIQSLIPFIIASMLASLSVVPMTMAKIESPLFAEPEALRLSELYCISPSGTIGCFIAGLVMGGIYGLLPVYAVNIGLTTSQTAWFMGLTITGGMILQYPVGMLSDRFGRRAITLIVSASFIITSLLIISCQSQQLSILLALVFFWGGFAFVLYPLSINHACDYLSPRKIIGATQGLLLAYGMGASVGPITAPIFMKALGTSGLMIYFIIAVGLLTGFILWRKTKREALPIDEQQAFVPAAAVISPVLNELDPRSEPTDAILTTADPEKSYE